MLDVLIYDTVSAPKPWSLDRPIGGVETSCCLLRDALNDAGISCEISDQPLDSEKVILSRWTHRDPAFEGRRVLRWVQDQEPRWDPWTTHVFCSHWQQRRYSNAPWRRDVVISPMIRLAPEAVQRARLPVKHRNKAVYAATPNKGWAASLAHCPMLECICAGEIGPATFQWQLSGFSQLVHHHTYPEVFPASVYLAKQLGLELDVRCVDHDTCGWREAAAAGDLSPTKILPQWLEVLGY